MRRLFTLVAPCSVAALAAVVVAAPAAADDLPSPPKSGTILTANWEATKLAAARAQSQNNLKQIALAFHFYHDTTGQFPAGIYARAEDPKAVGLSWRVQILPYIEHEALYREFKLEEPWNSEHNKKLIAKMPKVFAPPPGTKLDAGLTYYRAFTGEGVIPTPVPAGKPGQPVRGIKFTDVTDGTSNTAMVAEAGDPVVWTKPDELAYDAKKPLPALGGVFEKGFNVALCDGSVRFLPRTIDEKVMRAVITRAGGEVVNLP